MAPAFALAGCATSGSRWMSEPAAEVEPNYARALIATAPEAAESVRSARPARTLPNEDAEATLPGEPAGAPNAGRVLGRFRNTYYDFPNQNDFEGETVGLKDPRCQTLAQVPRGFYEAVCVQGSGTLANGNTVSFAARDCACAELCPRTAQRICFHELDARQFPWGRGATGRSITPLLTVAVDSDVIALGTPLYIPEFDGLPRDSSEASYHDGCFIAQDRGLHVKGEHVDIFTGDSSLTELWNRLVPSNAGVTVVLDHPRCTRADTSASAGN